MFYNLAYIFGSWKLGIWEIGAKIFVFQEVYETLLYLLAPFVLPISLIVKPAFCAYLMLGTLGLYFFNVTVSSALQKRPIDGRRQVADLESRSSTKSTSAAETNASSGKSYTSTTPPTRSS